MCDNMNYFGKAFQAVRNFLNGGNFKKYNFLGDISKNGGTVLDASPGQDGVYRPDGNALKVRPFVADGRVLGHTVHVQHPDGESHFFYPICTGERVDLTEEKEPAYV